MPLKTPHFWRERGGLSALLLPLSFLYLAGHKLNTWLTKSYKSTLPVICVGGVVAGGSGKTPVTHAMIKLIRKNGLAVNPVILTRGYGGRLKGPTLVDPVLHTVTDVGDEALLHAMHAQTIVSANRANGAKLAEAMGADIVVMDDGLQNNSLVKTLSFLVLDTRQGLGNRCLLPAGPLREPLQNALDKCVCIIQTNGKADPQINKPIITTSIGIISDHDKSREVYAFAGLGNPEKFKLTLEESGFRVADFQSFADHHPYSPRDMEKIKNAAAGLPVFTTQKDYMRIPQAYKNSVEQVIIEQTFDHEALIVSYLRQAMAR